MSGALPAARPWTIAHRAANHPAALREALAAGVDLVEGDLWLYGGRLEVRHLKTLGPVPVLWDRWRLVLRRSWRLELLEILAAMRPEACLLLDLKGTDRRLPAALAEALAAYSGSVAVCSRNWALLEPFRRREGMTVLYSAGNGRELRRLPDRLAGPGGPGVSVHRRLLTPDVVRALRERASAVVTWPVSTYAQARRLTAWGVDGLISDNLALLRALTRERDGTARREP
ncbi:MAG TPA: glycerophosphodiester phosphodiesterase [Dehalococcoidia bacterium]